MPPQERRVDPDRVWRWGLVLATGSVAVCTAALVWGRATRLAAEPGLLPRWDLAAHLLSGWTDYHYLITGQPHRLAWDLWQQGYWPPGPSLWQIPFHAGLGGTPRAGLASGLAAFVVALSASVAALALQSGRRALVGAAIFLGFAATSPFLLAYASLAMTEMPGAMAQAVVVASHVWFERSRRPVAAWAFALSLTALLFTKYNYFLLLAAPLVLHVYLTGTTGRSWQARAASAAALARALVATPARRVAALYLLLLGLLLVTGGTAFTIAGQRVALRTVGYLAHPLLYGALLRVWWLHRHGRIDWARLWAADPRLRPLAIGCVAPMALWLASPYPNHVKDAANLLVNIPMGEPTASQGLAAYLGVVRSDFFLHDALAGLALGGFLLALVRWRSSAPLVRLLVMSAILQFVLVTLHPTRDPRFVLLALPPFWLASAAALGALTARWPARAAAALAAVLCAAAVAGAGRATSSAAFERHAREHYIESPALASALASIRAATAADRLLVVGRLETAPPGLLAWHLGPPAGAADFPREVLRVADARFLDAAPFVLYVAPLVDVTWPPANVAENARATALAGRLVAAGTHRVVRRFRVDDAGVSLTLYRRLGTAGSQARPG
ncbi:MAG: hypothetical protein R2745_15125 [Vicinamibacterales bacterium]